MSFEEEFDKIIRQKAEDANYPFDESNWEKTSRLLDAQQKVAKEIAYKKVAVSALVILLVGSASLGAWYFLSDKTGTDSNLKATFNTEQLNTASSQNQSTFTKEQNSLSVDLKNTQSPHSEATLNTEPAAQISVEKKSNPTPSPANQSTVRKETKTNSELVVPKDQFPSVLNTFETKIASTEKDNKSTETQGTNSSNFNTQVVPSSLASEPSQIATPEPMAMVNVEDNLNKAESIQHESIQMNNLELTYTPAEAELYPTPFLMLMRYDDDYFKGRRPKTHYLNAEVGGTYLLGWDTKAGKDGKGFDWFAGMNYGLYLNKRFNASIGLQAYNIKNINQAFYNSEKTEYGFGSTNSYTVISSNNLYYATIPVKLAYAINTTNQIGLGVNIGYLFASKNTVNTYASTDGPNTNSSIKTTGVYQGTNTTNLLLSAFYKKQLNNRFNLNAEFIYGATDIFKNTGTIKNIEKPMGLRLSLQYTLFDK